MRGLILILASLLCASVCAASGPRVMFRKNGGGTITLRSDGTYTTTGTGAIVTAMADPLSDGDHYFTIDFLAAANVTYIKVAAAGAAGAKWGTGIRGRGCIINATGVPVNGQLIARIGVQPPDSTYSGGYGGGRGADGSGANGTAGGGGSTSLASYDGMILLEAGGGNGAAGGQTGTDASGDGGGVQDSTHGNIAGWAIGQGGGWTASHSSPYPATSKIVYGSGTYGIGAIGNSGTGYMTIVY